MNMIALLYYMFDPEVGPKIPKYNDTNKENLFSDGMWAGELKFSVWDKIFQTHAGTR